jgi:Phosphate-selective porin O and P
VNTITKLIRSILLVLAMGLPFSAAAQEQISTEDYQALKNQVEALQEQLQQVQDGMRGYEEQMSVKEGQVEQEVTQLKEDVARADEWKQTDTLIHLAGYADVSYAFAPGNSGDFGVGRFAPIFHYQYRDLVMLESELEVTIDDAGETDVALEYLSIDYFLNDYVALVAGKFLSPVGQFRQNLHPSWINKLASAPPGFGHDGAAPTSDIGLQARGGFPMGGIFSNYAVYVSNGPELRAGFEDGEYELEGIVAEGLNADIDGDKVVGGRFGILPARGLEIGISGATGKATITALELEEDVLPPDPIPDLQNERSRDYSVFGADFVWSYTSFQLRGEYIRSKIGAAVEGITASPGATWSSWYTQASYLIPQTKFEPVIRYANFDSPHASQDQEQWGLGMNYLISNNVIAKASYEYNEGVKGSKADSDLWLFQLAYGF